MRPIGILNGGRVNGIKVLVIGGSGFVGRHIMDHFACPGTSFSGKSGFVKLDIRDHNEVNRVVMEFSPEIVVNSSGITNVDYCETHEDEAMAVNGKALEYIADVVENAGSSLFHISTDYVFPGTTNGYSEDEKPYPVNVYGHSKLLGEKLLEDRKCTVIRISTPYGINKSGAKTTFMEFVLNNLKMGQKIKIVTDQYTTPTYVGDIGPAIEALHRYKQTGLFHLGSGNCVSRYEFAMILSEVFSFDKSLITPVRTKDLGLVAQRPLNCCMKTEKIRPFVRLKEIRENLVEVRELLKETA